MPHDPALVAETLAWVQKAHNDIRAAEADLGATPPLLDDLVFHAQQAAEKVLKAFLTWHRLTFRKTHNLLELGEACVSVDPTLGSLLRGAAPLTEYAWKFRYPGDLDMPSAEEARSALETARAVVGAVLDRLPVELRRG